MRSLRTIIFFVAIQLCYTLGIQAQVQIKLLLSKDTVSIGENLDLSLSLEPGNNTKLVSFSISMPDSIGLYKILLPEDSTVQAMEGGFADYEIVDYGKWQNTGKNQLTGDKNGIFDRNASGNIENQLAIRIWDAGDYMVMLDEIRYIDQDNDPKTFYPEMAHAQIIHVRTPEGTESEEGLQLAPISNIMREGWHWTDFKWLYLAVGLIIIAIFALSWSGRRKRKSEQKIARTLIQRPAHEIALEKLELLHEKSLWQQGEIKAYQSELTFILREYLENRYHIKALESTTGEIVEALANENLDKVDIGQVSELLQIADLVKFAKAKPDINIHEQFYMEALTFVRKTKFIKQDNETDK